MSSKDLSDIRLVAFDVDGVFTDGRFYLSEDGVESKAFHTQDGYGIRQLLDEGISFSARALLEKRWARFASCSRICVSTR